MSKLRKIYFIKLIIRICILIYIINLYITKPNEFIIIISWNMFNKFSFLHILYIIWIYDMICQIIPSSKNIALGSQKLFLNKFKDISTLTNDAKNKIQKVIKDEANRLKIINYESLKNFIINSTKKAYRVFIIWISLTILIGILFFLNIITYKEIFLLSTIFFVCDLICVLIWCPFRLIMGNKCCTTCRIFNWDHAMMFLPLIYIPGLYTTSLVLLSISIWIIWEVHMMIYPERFWEITNVSLRCSECTDKLCTQYCQKLRK